MCDSDARFIGVFEPTRLAERLVSRRLDCPPSSPYTSGSGSDWVSRARPSASSRPAARNDPRTTLSRTIAAPRSSCSLSPTISSGEPTGVELTKRLGDAVAAEKYLEDEPPKRALKPARDQRVRDNWPDAPMSARSFPEASARVKTAKRRLKGGKP